MATTMKVGQSSVLVIEYLDQDGKPMVTNPVPDTDPSWGNTSPSVDTVTASPTGEAATVLAIGAGSDTVRVQLSVGGVQYQATVDFTVEAAAPQQTLTSIGIIVGPPTP